MRGGDGEAEVDGCFAGKAKHTDGRERGGGEHVCRARARQTKKKLVCYHECIGNIKDLKMTKREHEGGVEGESVGE